MIVAIRTLQLTKTESTSTSYRIYISHKPVNISILSHLLFITKGNTELHFPPRYGQAITAFWLGDLLEAKLLNKCFYT